MAAAKVQLGPLAPRDVERFGPQIPALIRATGPVSYDYQFGVDGLLERLVKASWPVPETLFCAASVTAALDGDELLGIELGFAGPDFARFRSNLAALTPDLIARGAATQDEIIGLAERARKASYLNAVVPDDVYYLHALSVPPEHRGKGVGQALLDAAVQRARAAGYRELQLDVLSTNQAVGFYRAMGLEMLSEVQSPELSRFHAFPSEYRMGVAL